jgi:murein DD-endopeptidase MepM/ murein hydrolase activator NlpD
MSVYPLPKKFFDPAKWTLDQGVDIPAPAHTPLLAVGDGVIVRHGIGGFGDWAPVLKLNDGHYVYYGHAGPGNMVRDGTRVKAGQVIGEVGAGRVGISTGPHLEIGFANAAGNPLAHSTSERGPRSPSALMHALLLGSDPHRGGITDTVVGGALDTANAVGDLPGEVADLPGKTASAIVDAIWNPLKEKAAYGGVFTLAILAGAALFVIGAVRAAGVKKAAAA